MYGGAFMEENVNKTRHTVFSQNRESIEMSGITEVGAFNEETVEASSDWGDIVIKGSQLHIETIDLETGALKVTGKITAVIYSDRIKSNGFFRRVFS